jgi:putative DNA methylase
MLRKLIEVALPLEAINREAALRKRKAPGGYPTTLHKWWAQRPLAACRAVLFASLVDDPSSHPGKFETEEAQEVERQRLFRIIEDLVKWENSNDETILKAARTEILNSTGGNPPPVLDPFCGGGSIPLEAQRLGLEVHASDLNPVAVLITKALVEIPPKFAGKAPVNPEAQKKLDHSKEWKGVQGLAEDVRHYGRWMRDEAERRIGRFYPKVELPIEYGGGHANAIAWLWARTVKCPNPACGAQMPLITSFALSTKAGKAVFLRPVIDKTAKTVSFEIESKGQKPAIAPKTGRGAKFRCLVCAQDAGEVHIKTEASCQRMGKQLLAIVAEGPKGRLYVPRSAAHEEAAHQAQPLWAPEEELPYEPRAIWCTAYGLKTYRDLFTPRQLVGLTTFSALVGEVRERVLADGKKAGLSEEEGTLADGGTGAVAYADTIAAYIAFALSRAADYGSSLSSWRPKDAAMRSTFSKQGLPMVWDYAEANPFGSSSAGFSECVAVVSRSLEFLIWTGAEASVRQLDAATLPVQAASLVCTDPPYYDNIGYADLSDFFYVWLRHSLGKIWPDLFSTLLVPKKEELIASPYRFNGNKKKADAFFEEGLGRAFVRLREAQHTAYPMTLFYAFRQSEEVQGDDEENEGVSHLASTGWETMLEGLLKAGFAITGTWPMRTEGDNRQVGIGANALASSIVLACRPRPDSATLATRKELQAALKKELPVALKQLQHGNIAPVDLAQASIGPGMAVYSRYSKVIEPNGDRLSVRTALGLINQVLDEVLSEQEGEFDADSRWALAWFEQYGLGEGPYGTAETLSKAKDTAIGALVEDGILEARKGKVRLLSRDELSADWDPAGDKRLTVWEVTQHLIRRLLKEGEASAAELLRKVGGYGETARDLAYRLYSICEKKGWAQEAGPYNSLVTSWPELVKVAAEPVTGEQQAEMFGA